jgi:putative ABC transport system substrate-binding protein
MMAPQLVLSLVLTIGLLAAPLAADAQPIRIPRIGWLGNGSPAPGSPSLEAFRRGLQQRGWIEGQTVRIEYRWAEGNPDRFPALVADLARLKVDVIVLSGSAAIRAAKSATSTVPIVFVYLADPVTAGFVPGLARPGGNLTGVASEFESLITKQLELLKEVVPTLSRVAVLHRLEIAPAVLRAAEMAARGLGLTARPLKVAEVTELEPAFRTARSEGVGAIHVLPSPFFSIQRRSLIELAARYRLPAVYEFKEYVEDGGLMSYGPSINEMFRGSASHVDRILKGARPGDLPIERPATFEFVVNLRTAKALGLTIPPPVLTRVDQVIE